MLTCPVCRGNSQTTKNGLLLIYGQRKSPCFWSGLKASTASITTQITEASAFTPKTTVQLAPIDHNSICFERATIRWIL